MIIVLFIIPSIIAFITGIIIGTKANEINRYKHCKVVRIRNYIKGEDGVIKKLNK